MKAAERIIFAFIALLVAGSLIAATPIKNLIFQGDADAGGFQITNLADPTNSSNAATLGSVTNQIATASTNYATAVQGTKADTALQAGSSWTNISGLGTAATNDANAFAIAAQGTKADSAVQPGGNTTFTGNNTFEEDITLDEDNAVRMYNPDNGKLYRLKITGNPNPVITLEEVTE